MPYDAETGDFAYCLSQVREFDRGRYLAALFAPAATRADLLALYAFNLEVARIRESIREPMMGLIRLQWWRDCLGEIHAGSAVRRHQVAQPLTQAIRARGLPRAPFDRLIEGREADLDEAPPADLPALRRYAEATGGELSELALRICAADPAPATLAGARDLGAAWALIGLVRAVPFHARARRVYLPQALLDEAGVRLGDLLELRPGPALAGVAARVCGEARALLAQARQTLPRPPRAALPALLPALLARRHLAALRAAGHDPFAPSLQGSAPASPWPLFGAWLAGRPW
jgi:phytoene synthase